MRQNVLGITPFNSVLVGITGFYMKLNSVKPTYTNNDSWRIKTEVFASITVL